MACINPLLFLLFALPTWVDGDISIIYNMTERGGDPVLTINDEIVLRHGRGPNEIEPMRCTYDPILKRVWISDGFRSLIVNARSRETIERITESRYSTLRGTWGKYRIIYHHDWLRNRNMGGRLQLENGEDVILLAQLSAAHVNRQDLAFFVRSENALVVMDNVNRSIGYVPLVSGNLETIRDEKLDALVPAQIKWFPMPQVLRETPIYNKRHELIHNNFLWIGVEIHSGLFAMVDSEDVAYLYDLSNTSSYYLGQLELPGLLSGEKSGKLLIRDMDQERLLEIDPLQLVTN